MNRMTLQSHAVISSSVSLASSESELFLQSNPLKAECIERNSKGSNPLEELIRSKIISTIIAAILLKVKQEVPLNFHFTV